MLDQVRKYIFAFINYLEYEKFSTAFLAQLNKERDENQKSLNDLNTNVKDLKELFNAYVEQEELNNKY